MHQYQQDKLIIGTTRAVEALGTADKGEHPPNQCKEEGPKTPEGWRTCREEFPSAAVLTETAEFFYDDTFYPIISHKRCDTTQSEIASSS